MRLLSQLVKSHKQLLMLCFSLGLAAKVYSVGPDYFDLATGSDGTASSSGALSPPDMALDGRPETHWGNDSVGDAPHADSIWYFVELGGKYLVDSVNIAWDSSASKEYYIQVSDSVSYNDSNWTNVAHITDGVTSEKRGIKFTATQASYVRIRNVHRVNGKASIMIKDWEIWGRESLTSIAAPNLHSRLPNSKNAHSYLLNGRMLPEKQSVSNKYLPTFKK